ncbi:MAG: heavy metal translocating P-type ATPase [Balneolaceae bacterium]
MENDDREKKLRAWLTGICGVALAAGFFGNITGLLPDPFIRPLYILAYLTGGYSGTVEMLRDFRERKLNIDFLMITAAVGAALIDQWLEGAILLFLFSLSESLEGFALGKSRNAIHSLMKLRPDQALVRDPNGNERYVSVEELKVGETVIVKPGEHIPIDGVVLAGETRIDQSAITGESVPVTRTKGENVFAATLNQDGAIQIRVTRPSRETTLANIIRLVEQAQDNKARSQRFLERFEPIYTIAVLTAVALLILIPWLMLGQGFDPVFYRAITLLVVASPCALIISTPAAIISAIANGARNGILFKGGIHVEQSNRIDTIAFDKTGTLTRGTPIVTDILPLSLNGTLLDEKELLEIAAGCEQYSEHHLAEAILNRAEEQKVQPVQVNNPQTVPGQGIYGTWNGETVSAGNRRLFRDQLETWPKEADRQAQALEKEGKTVIFIARNNQPIGLFAMADQLRPTAAKALQALRAMGVRKIVMLTGDNRGVAEEIARRIDLDEIHAELLPEQKVEKIRELRRDGVVAMVGDGINDAPALANSDLGIAMGAAGTDVALETADVVLMGDDLEKIPYLLRLSEKTKRIVWQNIGFSLMVIFMLILALFWIDLPLTAGVIGHEGSTLIVVLNGLRLLRSRSI